MPLRQAPPPPPDSRLTAGSPQLAGARAVRAFPARRASSRSPALDGLRGAAALAVLLFHVWLYRAGGLPGPRHSLSSQVLFELNLGLICFFVLSGYLLYRPFVGAALRRSEPVSWRSYALRRAARVAPGYYLCVAGSLLLYRVVGADALVPSPKRTALFAVFGQSYSMHTLTAIDAVTWTLCVEVAFYALLPVLGRLARRLGPDRLRAQVSLPLALVALSLGWNALVYLRHWDPVASKSLPAYAGDFALGMLAALWIERRRSTANGPRRLGAGPTRVLAGAGMLLVVATGFWHETFGSGTPAHAVLVDLPAAVGFSLLIAAAAAGRGAAVAWLRWRPLVAAGTISYGVYLWHIPLILCLLQLGLLPAAIGLRLLVVLALTVAAASVSWVWVERPILNWASARPRRGPNTRSSPQRPVTIAPATGELP